MCLANEDLQSERKKVVYDLPHTTCVLALCSLGKGPSAPPSLYALTSIT